MTVYSHSRLSTFEACPLRYWYAYIAGPDIPRIDTVEAFLGSRVHDALELLYRQVGQGRVMEEAELVALYDRLWDRHWHDGVRIVNRDSTADDYRGVGREALGRYHERYHPFDQGRTLGLEARVFVAMDDGRYTLQGYIDRLARRPDGVYEIHDYKTSHRVATQDEADADRQLALYQMGIEAIYGSAIEVDLVWHYLRYDREVRSRRSPQQLDAVRRQCIALIEDIESRGRDEAGFPACPSRLCAWCDFQEICRAAELETTR